MFTITVMNKNKLYKSKQMSLKMKLWAEKVYLQNRQKCTSEFIRVIDTFSRKELREYVTQILFFIILSCLTESKKSNCE